DPVDKEKPVSGDRRRAVTGSLLHLPDQLRSRSWQIVEEPGFRGHGIVRGPEKRCPVVSGGAGRKRLGFGVKTDVAIPLRGWDGDGRQLVERRRRRIAVLLAIRIGGYCGQREEEAYRQIRSHVRHHST